jgi:hypothetical protein
VLEIEAADGRNRSHASRVGQGQRRKARLESNTLAQASMEPTALMRSVAKAWVRRCTKRRRVQLRIHGVSGWCASISLFDTVEGVLGRGCIIPLRGW